MIDAKFFHQEIQLNQLKTEPLETIIRWCRTPYPRHSSGCPNCTSCQYWGPPIIETLSEKNNRDKILSLAWVEFDLEKYAKDRQVNRQMTDLQARCLLYWQKSLKKFLVDCIIDKRDHYKHFLNAEGRGVNFYETMKGIGVPPDKMNNLKIVRLIAIVLSVKQTKLW